jgi:DNA uptake protein ComE-like DNA-binding protein
MWETIRGYLTFTRKERYGVLFLLLLISIFFILPYFIKTSPGDRDPQTNNKIRADVRSFESRVSDSSRETENHGRYPPQKRFSVEEYQSETERNAGIHMFYFDPNKIQRADWIKLGLPDRLSQTICRYLEKGGHFHKAEDLKKLYGLHDADYKRLYPFVRIPMSSGNSVHDARKSANYNSNAGKHDSLIYKRNPEFKFTFHRGAKYFVVTDVNVSDSNDWAALPGIGEKLASRIVHFREKLGGFYQIDQVAETFGLADTIFQKIKPYLRIGSVSIHRIDINSATKEMLALHPYIRWPLARSITEYRLQHGSFHSVDELLQLVQMDPAKFEKMKPYLEVNQ